MGAVTSVTVRGPVTAKPEEAGGIKELFKVLERKRTPRGRFLVLGSEQQKTEIPPSVFQVMTQVAQAMARGQSVAIIAYEQQLSTQQAAEILGVSRPYLIGLLEAGVIPFHKVGTHRRLRMDDVLAYKSIRDGQRHQTLRELRRVSRNLGLYDDQGPVTAGTGSPRAPS